MKLSLIKLAAPVGIPLALSVLATAAMAQGIVPPGMPVSPSAALNALVPPDMGNVENALTQAQTQRKNGDLAGATKTLSQLVLFAPDDPRVLAEYGKTLVAQARSDDALAFLERAIQLNPSDWTLYSASGVAYDQKGIYKSAQIAYGRALALKPGEPAILNNAALSHMQAGDLDGAEKLLLQVPPGNNDVRIAQNLALIQNLKATRTARMPSAPAAAPAIVASAAPAQVAPVAPVTPAPAPEVSAPVVSTPAPVESAALPAPMVEEKTAEAPVPSAPTPAPEAPTEPNRSVALTGVAALEADPTVRVQALPKEEPRPAAPKVVTAPAAKAPPAAKPAPAEKKIASAAPAKKPTLSVSQNAAKPATGGAGTYYVQAGAFATEERADKMAATLDKMGARVSAATVGGRSVFRVRIGPFADMRQANAAMEAAQSMGHQDLRLVSE